MYPSTWTQLGIEPTADLIAIKRAYAVRLKRTRPDDDAQAYQALREAYEQAQAWARWRQDDTADEDAAPLDEPRDEPPAAALAAATGAAPIAAPVEPLPPAPALPAQPTPEPAPFTDDVDPIGAVTDGLDAAWSAGQSQAVMASWPAWQARFDDVPLDDRTRLELAVADWTLSRRAIDPDLLQALAQHFAWTGDFRASRRLGWQRAQDLAELLDERLDLQSRNPAMAQRLEPLRRLVQWRHEGSVWRMLLCMVLMGEPLHQLLRDTPPKLLGDLCARPDSHAELALWFKRAFWLRAWAPALLVAATVGWIKGGAGHALGTFVMWAMLTLGLGTVAVYLARWISLSWGLTANGSPLRARVGAWLEHPNVLTWGLALLVAASALAAVPLPADWEWLGLFVPVLWAAGVRALWPASLGDGFMVLGLSGLVGLLVLPFGIPLPLVSLWALGSLQAFERGWHVGRWGWPVRMLFGFGTHTLSLGRQGGFLFALTPAAVVATLHWAQVLPSVGAAFLAWLAGLWLLGLAQAAAIRWAAPRLGLSAD